MGSLRVPPDRLRQRVWLVLAVTAAAVLAALAAALGQPPSYTGRATLTLLSPSRAAEPDAAVAQGYAEYFNERSYQQVLARAAGVPAELTVRARTVRTSPILSIEATADTPELAASASAAMARAFLADVNAGLLADRQSEIADLRNQITQERALLLTLPESSPEAALSAATILALRSRIQQLQADTANQLRELRSDAGVSANTPPLVRNGALGLVGGLGLGLVLALASGRAGRRLGTARQVRDQLGLDTLAVLPGGRSKAAERLRAQRFKQLANLLSLGDLPRPGTVAVISPVRSLGTAQVAGELAYYRALQGERTLRVCADLHPRPGRRGEYQVRRGVADILANPQGAGPHGPGPGPGQVGLEGAILPGECDTLQVMPPGSAPDDPYPLFGRERFTDLVRRVTDVADLVVIEAPPVTEAAEGQTVCAIADRTILVIEAGATGTADAAAACRLLAQVDATLLGVVITRAPGRSGSGRGRRPSRAAGR